MLNIFHSRQDKQTLSFYQPQHLGNCKTLGLGFAPCFIGGTFYICLTEKAHVKMDTLIATGTVWHLYAPLSWWVQF